MTRPLPASVLLLPTVTARLIKSTWDQRNILISWERIAVFSASVLSHKFVYKSGRRWQEFHGGFGPNEGLGMVISGFDIAADGVLQFAGGAMNTPPDLLFGQGGEPALDQVQPRGAGRREVHMEPRMTGQPAMNQGHKTVRQRPRGAHRPQLLGLFGAQRQRGFGLSAWHRHLHPPTKVPDGKLPGQGDTLCG